MMKIYVLRPEDVPSYSPANHSGTKNYRLVSPEVNGAKYLEVIYGDIQRHAGSVAHAHPDMERVTYVIEGEATAEIDGTTYAIKAGDVLFFPANVIHDLKVISERIKLLVVYAPPYGEDPKKVIKRS